MRLNEDTYGSVRRTAGELTGQWSDECTVAAAADFP